jgi:hypothetical protein
MPLQTANHDGFVLGAQNACALTELLDRAYSSASGAEKVGLKNCVRRTGSIVRSDFLDEAGDVDVRRAGVGAGRIVAEQASMRFNEGLVFGQRG